MSVNEVASLAPAQGSRSSPRIFVRTEMFEHMSVLNPSRFNKQTLVAYLKGLASSLTTSLKDGRSSRQPFPTTQTTPSVTLEGWLRFNQSLTCVGGESFNTHGPALTSASSHTSLSHVSSALNPPGTMNGVGSLPSVNENEIKALWALFTVFYHNALYSDAQHLRDTSRNSEVIEGELPSREDFDSTSMAIPIQAFAVLLLIQMFTRPSSAQPIKSRSAMRPDIGWPALNPAFSQPACSAQRSHPAGALMGTNSGSNSPINVHSHNTLNPPQPANTTTASLTAAATALAASQSLSSSTQSMTQLINQVSAGGAHRVQSINTAAAGARAGRDSPRAAMSVEVNRRDTVVALSQLVSPFVRSHFDLCLRFISSMFWGSNDNCEVSDMTEMGECEDYMKLTTTEVDHLRVLFTLGDGDGDDGLSTVPFLPGQYPSMMSVLHANLATGNKDCREVITVKSLKIWIQNHLECSEALRHGVTQLGPGGMYTSLCALPQPMGVATIPAVTPIRHSSQRTLSTPPRSCTAPTDRPYANLLTGSTTQPPLNVAGPYTPTTSPSPTPTHSNPPMASSMTPTRFNSATGLGLLAEASTSLTSLPFPSQSLAGVGVGRLTPSADKMKFLCVEGLRRETVVLGPNNGPPAQSGSVVGDSPASLSKSESIGEVKNLMIMDCTECVMYITAL
eukprot:GHVN01004406.1.p1 GENE.GHVN01004406.1~~GHVN01004406.1.p1  ORF type:complete len:677 (+),score=137.21 GHVN01004406.1:47-2077(+)